MSRKYKRVEKSVKSKTAAPAGRSKNTHPPRRSSKSFRTVILVALLLVAVFGVGYLIVNVAGEMAPWEYSEEISPEQARKQIGSGAVVLDVRTYEEFVAGHIEKSLWMPLEELTSLMQALPRGPLIITVCRTGVLSIQARYILQEDGFTEVTSLKGGMEAWLTAGYPVVYGEPVRVNN